MGRDVLRYLYVVLIAVVVSQALPAFAKAPDKPLDLNRASESELLQLPGVGKSRAAAIVKARNAKPFRKVTDLMRVRGFGKKRFQQVKPHVQVQAK